MIKHLPLREPRGSVAVTCTSLLALLLGGCGGGGSGDSTGTSATAVAAPATTNPVAAWEALGRTAHSYSLSGSVSTGAAVSAMVTVTPLNQVTSSGVTFDVFSTVNAVTVNGSTTTTVSTEWSNVGTPSWGLIFNSDGTCWYRTGGTALPTTATLGQAGPFLTGTQLPGCNASNLPTSLLFSVGTITQSWSYNLVNGRPSICINTTDVETVGTVTQSQCIEITDTAGTIGTHAQITSKDLNGTTVTLSN